MSKFIMIALSALFSFSVFAEVPTYWPKEVTCQEIQASMSQYGSVRINIKYLFGMDTVNVYSDRNELDCGYEEVEKTMKVRTKDGIKCVVGFYCLFMPNP